MKKSTIGIVALALLLLFYFGGTYATSRMAQGRVELLTDFMAKQSMGMLKVVDKKSTPGYFSSVEDVTFELNYPLLTMILQKPTLQFTIHNVIQHGPLPGFRAVGIARVESTVVMDDATKKMLIDTLGTDQPVEIAVTFGFLGSTTLDVNSPAMNIKAPNEAGTFAWKGLKSRTTYARGFESFDMDATMPGVSVKGKDGSGMEMKNLEVKGEFKKAFDPLYAGDFEMRIEAIDFAPTPASREVLHIEKVVYGVSLDAKGDFLDMNIKVGAKSFVAGQPPLKDAHFDFSLKHLHGPTIASFVKYAQELGMKTNPLLTTPPIAGVELQKDTANPDEDRVLALKEEAPGGADQVPNAESPTPAEPPIDFAKLQEQATTLLKHSPELSLDHLGFATDKGDLKISALAKFVGITDSDLVAMDSSALMSKIQVTADLSVAKGLIDNWPFPSQQGFKSQFLQMEQQGFLKANGDRFETHIEFVKGKLTANGKSL